MLNQLVVPNAEPIPDEDVAAVRAWAVEFNAPAEVLEMLLGVLEPADPEPVRQKLVPSQVREIRRLHSTGLPTVRIAERFKVSQNTVTDIVRGRTWRNLR
jgi:DNA-binding NarL/FixJ family response regulator